MTQIQKKRTILKKTKSKTKLVEAKDFSLMVILKRSARFAWCHKKNFLIWVVVNFIFLFTFSLIPNGWTNSLSILWLVAYYIYWCIFIRSIQNHTPYFSLIRICNGLIPISKIMFINISIYLLITITPFIPLFMGFREQYLEFFEQYMGFMESNQSLTGKMFFYIFMLLISPITFSRPYLAWIASLIGKTRSIVDAYKRTRGNYWTFVLCALVMSALFIIAYDIDTIYQIHTLKYLIAVLSIYFNIVFINIYKVFYQHKSKTKTSI